MGCAGKNLMKRHTKTLSREKHQPFAINLLIARLHFLPALIRDLKTSLASVH